jgi:putative flippase GtrA
VDAGQTAIELMQALPSRRNRQVLSRFLVVGAVGFCTDGGLLSWLMGQGWTIVQARSLSFLAAVSITWWLNRVWTFRAVQPAAPRREYVLYFLTQVGGALINLLVFFVLVHAFETLRHLPLIPLAAGAAVAIVFNFSVSRLVVYKYPRP